MGRLLNEVVYGGDYKEWDYDDFEAYCAKELGLKKATVQKLMVSYNYMKKHQASKLDALEKGESVSMPSFETVSLLDKVHRRESLDDETMNDLKFQAFSKPISEASEAEIKKRLRVKKEVDPLLAEKASVLRAARTLRKEMSRSHFVPDGLRERIEEPLVELEALNY